MFRSALLILSGNTAASVLIFARNLIIARLIPVADYGIAATFAITMTVVEMASALGLQQQIVQSKNGDDPRFQAALQGFQLLRGVLAGALLFVSAHAIARFLGIPDVAWAYQVMALIPVLNALQHFDIHRLHRHMRFWPMVLTGGVPALISLIAVWPLYQLFGDYQVMLWAILVQIGLMCAISHMVAERPYRLVFDRAIMGQSLRFGWPLLVNGMLMFAVFNGDKLIVGRLLGMETLALFAMGVTLTLMPTVILAKSAQNFFLPQLSRTVSDPSRFDTLGRVTLQVGLLNGGALLVAVILFGGPFIQITLGDKYAALIPLLIWLAMAQALRVFKSGPAVVALSKGHSSNAMLANLPRVATLPLIWWMLQSGWDLVSAILVGAIGELLGYALSLWLLRRRTGLVLRPMWGPLALMFGVLVAAGFLAASTSATQSWIAASLLAALTAACLWSMADLRRYILRRPTPALHS